MGKSLYIDYSKVSREFQNNKYSERISKEKLKIIYKYYFDRKIRQRIEDWERIIELDLEYERLRSERLRDFEKEVDRESLKEIIRGIEK